MSQQDWEQRRGIDGGGVVTGEALSLGESPRGRVLVIEGGSGQSARRFPPRPGRPAPALSVILSAISPQVLLAAEAVDTVHLPAATDASGILAHLRSAVRHPGPLLVHIGGHLVRDRRTGGAQLDLGGSHLPWQTVIEELRLRPVETTSLVIADLSAEESLLPPLRVVPSPLGAGLPLWAAVSPDPQQVGTFTRALVEALHGGRPGEGGALTPEQLHQQVHSVLRPEVLLVVSHGPGSQVFRNTARRLEARRPQLPLPGKPLPGRPEPGTLEFETMQFDSTHIAAPPSDAPPSDLPPSDPPPFDLPPPPVHPPTVHLTALEDYQQAIAVIVAAADAGEHARASAFACELEREAVTAHGPDADLSLQVRQVRAHVSRLAGQQADAADQYRAVALSLLGTRGADDPETRQAAANAEACWRAIEDDAEARRLGPDLLALRRDVPDERRLRAVERHLARLDEFLVSR
ncbi:hypothetical protein [Streptacidiphilus sp. MAP12-16]|uniref:hypothetical protein n=1 Tax=Streptacidiphilus sp. MAP12-16 TaxID=3156300 RepID=UPI003516EB90